jgi:hypothetical protein
MWVRKRSTLWILKGHKRADDVSLNYREEVSYLRKVDRQELTLEIQCPELFFAALTSAHLALCAAAILFQEAADFVVVKFSSVGKSKRDTSMSFCS